MKLCGRGKCCAEINVIDEGYEITDDYGGSVILTEEELKQLKKYKI